MKSFLQNFLYYVYIYVIPSKHLFEFHDFTSVCNFLAQWYAIRFFVNLEHSVFPRWFFMLNTVSLYYSPVVQLWILIGLPPSLTYEFTEFGFTSCYFKVRTINTACVSVFLQLLTIFPITFLYSKVTLVCRVTLVSLSFLLS